MHGIDEAHLAFLEIHDQGMSAGAIAEETHAAEDIAVGDAGAGEDDLAAGSEIFGFVNALGVSDAHFGQAFLMFGLADHQARQHLAIEATQRRGGEHAFGGAACAHDSMNAGADDGRGDAGGKIAVADQADARAGGANIFDELLVAGAVENDDDKIFFVAVETPSDGADIVDHGRVKVDRALATRADHDFFHI